tara:strand:- start:1037 stop:1444 length:408 start_codon:yes stop_codon:yes gene_type:complete
VGHILYKQKIKVMTLNLYLQLLNQEIQSKSLTVNNTLIEPLITVELISGITTTTGTAGTTIDYGATTVTGTLDTIDGNGLIIIGILTILFIIAHLLDRKYSYLLAEEQLGSMSTVEEEKETTEMESTRTEIDMKN